MEEQSSQFRNREITCTDCESAFTFSAEEQRFYQEKGLDHEPKRCKPCRVARKSKALNRRSRPTRGNRLASFHVKGESHAGRLPSGSFSGQPPAGNGENQAPLFKADFGPSPWESSTRRFRETEEAQPSRTRYDAVCTDCNAATKVPFRPNGVQPVYCRTCLPLHRTRKNTKRRRQAAAGRFASRRP
ncbi:MAG: zinc-ribbon domain containing protein [Acidobacteriota bacterium]